MAQERFVVAKGKLTTKKVQRVVDETGDADYGNHFVFQFSSDLVLCNLDLPAGKVGFFQNDVKCRKWTDLENNESNICKLPPANAPPPPLPGNLVNIGRVTITTTQAAPPPRTFVCENFRLDGTQTHRTEDGKNVFLFTGVGMTQNNRELIRGAGTCPETLISEGPPQPAGWDFILTICPQ